MNCSIVIRVYKEEEHIRRLLDGIRHQTIKDVEIILVDAGSTDPAFFMAESFGARLVRIATDEFTFGRSLNFGTGLEDVAWAKWAKEQGYDIAYVAEAEVIHIHNETARGVFNRYRRESMAFKKIYPESHFNIYDFARLTTINILSDVWHAARERVLWKNLASNFWFRCMQFYGTRMEHRETSFLTPQLRETFYYARERKKNYREKRDIEPIRYNE